jgi:hypothetical protein
MSSHYWRTLGINFVTGVIIEFAICLIISWYFNDQNRFFYALLIMLAFWGVQLVIWAKNHLVSLIFYYLIGKRQLISHAVSQMRNFRMPIYDDMYAPDASAYLSKVIDDQQSSREQITFAAATAGQIQILKETKPTGAWRYMSVFETALERYCHHN